MITFAISSASTKLSSNTVQLLNIRGHRPANLVRGEN
jgi:hypothetical protein